jgi:hypothetical protein
MSITETRQDLADALADPSYSVYAFPNEVMFAPAIVLVPGSPYVLWQTPTRFAAKFILTLMVPNNDNQAALVNLEKMIETVAALIPDHVTVGDFSQPTSNEVGSTEYLTTDIELDVTIN